MPNFPKLRWSKSNTLVSSGMTEWWIISTLLAMVGSSPSGLLPSSSQASPSSRSASSLPSPTPTQWTSSLKSLSSTRKYRGRTWNVWLFGFFLTQIQTRRGVALPFLLPGSPELGAYHHQHCASGILINQPSTKVQSQHKFDHCYSLCKSHHESWDIMGS